MIDANEEMSATGEAVDAFIAEWRDAQASERSNAQKFLIGLTQLVGAEVPGAATGDVRRDAYVFDVPAYELALLLDLNNVPPVTFRRSGSDQVSLQVWLEGGMMETDRLTRGIDPPSGRHFRQQTQNMRVFDSLIGNVDRNSGNILIAGDWNFWLIDHSRAFLHNDDAWYLERVQACSRQLFARLKTLTPEEMLPVMSPPLSASEVNWVLRRRDKVAAHIDALIAEKGEGAVLFDDSR